MLRAPARWPRPAAPNTEARKGYSVMMTDENFFATYGMTVLAGQVFTMADNLGNFKFRRVMLNEAAALQFGFASGQDAVGKTVQWGLDSSAQIIEVVGVLKNYHHQSLKTQIEPIIILPTKGTGFFTLRINVGASGEELRAQIAQVQKLYERLLPGNPFSATFADELFQTQYEDESRISALFGIFTVVAIVIACLGLFGLATFAAESRTKEIGIRKVLGASSSSIIALLSLDFMRLVGISIVLAIPLA